MSGVPTRALFPGERYCEEIRPAIDTGERRTRWMEAGSSDGRKQASYELALVRIEGERRPLWIATSRLEPSDPDEHAAWLAEIDVERPRVERPVYDVDDVRRRARRRASRPRSEERSDTDPVRHPTGRDRRAPRVAGLARSAGGGAS